MKILCYTDNHWCQYSSILRKNGNNYSLRIENQIKSINWAENLAEQLKCDTVIHCGDFFDKESLNSVEITALNELNFYENATHFMLVGNHEMGRNDLVFSSAHLFGLKDIFTIIDNPVTVELNDFQQICFLPYILESNRKSISEYFPSTYKKRIIFSHNDIAGIQMGTFLSKVGFSIEDIENNCDLFINGHLHNGEQITQKIYNIGNLTGQNFSEDGFKYHHSAFIIDTDTLRIDVYDNPYAINFYKIDFTKNNDNINYINEISSKLHNAVVTIKCNEENYDYLKKRFGNQIDDIVPHCDNVIESRFIVERNKSIEEKDVSIISVDHINKFRECILEEFGNSDLILEELQEILK